ncbi:MAG TPA: MerR family transcriptional regulator, partial [Burkholderiaceae bacterium]
MQLKVGEFAKRTGMTVRMLHHLDSIGLLVPSARSEGDHRLYDQKDIARLHAIKALRQIGLPL